MLMLTDIVDDFPSGLLLELLLPQPSNLASYLEASSRPSVNYFTLFLQPYLPGLLRLEVTVCVQRLAGVGGASITSQSVGCLPTSFQVTLPTFSRSRDNVEQASQVSFVTRKEALFGLNSM